MTKIVQTDRARQGGRGKQVLIVLVSALVLTALVWAGVELYGESIDTPAQSGASTDQPAQSGTSTNQPAPSGTSTTTP